MSCLAGILRAFLPPPPGLAHSCAPILGLCWGPLRNKTVPLLKTKRLNRWPNLTAETQGRGGSAEKFKTVVSNPRMEFTNQGFSAPSPRPRLSPATEMSALKTNDLAGNRLCCQCQWAWAAAQAGCCAVKALALFLPPPDRSPTPLLRGAIHFRSSRRRAFCGRGRRRATLNLSE
jgi:hypothetical protein